MDSRRFGPGSINFGMRRSRPSRLSSRKRTRTHDSYRSGAQTVGREGQSIPRLRRVYGRDVALVARDAFASEVTVEGAHRRTACPRPLLHRLTPRLVVPNGTPYCLAS